MFSSGFGAQPTGNAQAAPAFGSGNTFGTPAQGASAFGGNLFISPVEMRKEELDLDQAQSWGNQLLELPPQERASLGNQQQAGSKLGSTLGGGGFGATSGSGFGTQTNAFGGAQAGAQPNAFGTSTQPAGGNMFGKSPAFGAGTTGGFGSGFAKTATGLGGFGGAGQQGQLGQSLGGGMSMNFGQQNQFQNSQMASSMMQRPPTILDKFKEIQGFWDPSSPTCQFKHYFYNMVHPSEIINDSFSMVPVLAVGFEDLKKRISQQDSCTMVHRSKLEDISEQLDSIERKHHLETATKVEEFKRRHAELAHRVLKIMSTVEVLRNKGYPIRAEEEALRGRLEAMDTQLKKPAHFRGRIQELQATHRMLKESRKLLSGDARETSEIDSVMDYNEQQMRLIGEALATAQDGLRNLKAILDEENRDLQIMEKGYGEKPFRTPN
ncbi:hypothetical protein HDU76_007887 [Blyttiomyces sp. JEL0837]|nr:hypothetical protein HDU76_007887 [Blyttiomyces sp. JEL0837]